MDLPVVTISDDTNCTSLMTELILDYFQIKDKDKYLKLLIGLGHGLDEGTLCGAVSGGYFAISTILTEKGASESEIRDVQEKFKSFFKEKYTSVNCSDILSSRFTTDDTYEEDVRQTRFCGSLLDKSTNELVELVNLAIAAMNPIMMRFDRH